MLALLTAAFSLSVASPSLGKVIPVDRLGAPMFASPESQVVSSLRRNRKGWTVRTFDPVGKEGPERQVGEYLWPVGVDGMGRLAFTALGLVAITNDGELDALERDPERLRAIKGGVSFVPHVRTTFQLDGQPEKTLPSGSLIYASMGKEGPLLCRGGDGWQLIDPQTLASTQVPKGRASALMPSYRDTAPVNSRFVVGIANEERWTPEEVERAPKLGEGDFYASLAAIDLQTGEATLLARLCRKAEDIPQEPRLMPHMYLPSVAVFAKSYVAVCADGGSFIAALQLPEP